MSFSGCHLVNDLIYEKMFEDHTIDVNYHLARFGK